MVRLLLLTMLASCSWMFPYKRVPANRGIVKEFEGKYYSARLKKVIPYWVALPAMEEGKPLPVVYFLHGRNGTRHMFRDLGGPGVLEKYLGGGGQNYAVVALTGAYSVNGANHNTYWVNGARPKATPWATIILQEMIPWIEKTHQFGGHPSKRMIAGISMGAHGAFQLALNTKRQFNCVAGHSLVVRDYQSMSSEFPSLFGTPQDFAKRDPLSLLKRHRKGSYPFKKVWLDIGGQDDPRFIEWARGIESELVRIGFSRKRGDKIDVAREFPTGDHTYVYWTKRLPQYLDWYGKCFLAAGTNVGASHE